MTNDPVAEMYIEQSNGAFILSECVFFKTYFEEKEVGRTWKVSSLIL